MSTATTNAVLDRAIAYLAAGISVIPIALDGSKAPPWDVLPRIPDEEKPDRFKPSWKPYQERHATDDEVLKWWDRPKPLGIAAVCGAVSGGLECIDFDDRATVREFLGEVKAECPGLYNRLSLEETPGGAHIWYRCAELEGNRKLALPSKRACEKTKSKFKAMIETRGEGGYAIVEGSPIEVHELKKPYQHVGGPSLTEVQEITPGERDYLMRLAQSFDRSDPPESGKTVPSSPGERGDLSPADDYDLRGEPFSQLLPDATFTAAGRDEGKVRRPDKERGYSATVGHCRGGRGEPLLKVFTTSWPPFEGNKCYGRFHVLRLTQFKGDGAACMRALRERGFGSAKPTRSPSGFVSAPSANGSPPPAAVVGSPDLDVVAEPWPDPLPPAALHGLAGDVVRLIDPHTEADPAAILFQFLVAFGNMIGRKAFYRIESSKHYANLFAVLVGQSSRARKGTSWQRAFHVLERGGDPGWAERRVVSGLSSGEGLIWEVRDCIQRRQRGEVVEVDPGVEDKRALVIEEEFASVLAVGKREGNILGSVLRSAWDTGRLGTLTKNTPARSTGAHISIISHITRAELLTLVTQTAAHNGFLNRFLWVAVKRSKLLPYGGNTVDVSGPARDLEFAYRHASSAEREVVMDADAKALWGQQYARLTAERTGLFGAVTSRSEAQTIRLALIYALLDCSDTIKLQHLRAALAVERYVEQSARHIFGDAIGDPLADEIRSLLRSNSAGVSQTDLINHFGRHKTKAQLEAALRCLVAAGLAKRESTPTGGRPKVIWIACEKSEVSEKSPPP